MKKVVLILLFFLMVGLPLFALKFKKTPQHEELKVQTSVDVKDENPEIIYSNEAPVSVEPKTENSILLDENPGNLVVTNEITQEVELACQESLKATSNCKNGIQMGNLCIDKSDLKYNPTNEGVLLADNNYWSGARDACEAKGMRLPNKDELALLLSKRDKITNFAKNPNDSYWTCNKSNKEDYEKNYYRSNLVHINSVGYLNHGDARTFKNNTGIKTRCMKLSGRAAVRNGRKVDLPKAPPLICPNSKTLDPNLCEGYVHNGICIAASDIPFVIDKEKFFKSDSTEAQNLFTGPSERYNEAAECACRAIGMRLPYTGELPGCNIADRFNLNVNGSYIVKTGILSYGCGSKYERETIDDEEGYITNIYLRCVKPVESGVKGLSY